MKKAVHSTMRDVAKAAGVSPMTVSRALKPGSTMAAQTRRKVLDCVESMNYVPDLKASCLSSRKSGIIAVLIPSLDNLHFAQTVQVVSEMLEAEGLQVLLGHTSYCPEKEEQLLRKLLRHRPECVVLACDGHTEKTRSILAASTVPVIEMWEMPDSPVGHTVGFSNRAAAEEMTRALIASGYSRIGFLGESGALKSRGKARLRGYQAAMQTAGLDASRVMLEAAPPMTVERGAQMANHMLNVFPDLDCLFCVSDPAAFGALHSFRAHGKRVPEDIALAGFGDFEVSRYAMPAISTVCVNPISIGEKVGGLIRQIVCESPGPAAPPVIPSAVTAVAGPLIITVPYSIELRAST